MKHQYPILEFDPTQEAFLEPCQILPAIDIADHYLPPAREVACSPEAVSALQSTLESHDILYILGKTRTTDAPYRETKDKMALRRNEGCLTVEMETAAFCAVAQFRGVTFGQILYGGDDLTGENWDSRSWQSLTSTREKLFWLAAESCLKL